MRRATPLSLALAAILGSAASGEAAAQTASAASDETLATVVVTGSNIRRSGNEGPNPVQIIDREQLETSSKVTVADVLRSISANTGNATNETTNNGWASGSA